MNEVARVVIEGVLCDAVTDSVTEATGKIPFNWLKPVSYTHLTLPTNREV